MLWCSSMMALWRCARSLLRLVVRRSRAVGLPALCRFRWFEFLARAWGSTCCAVNGCSKGGLPSAWGACQQSCQVVVAGAHSTPRAQANELAVLYPKGSSTAAEPTVSVCTTAVVVMTGFVWDNEPHIRRGLRDRGFTRVAMYSAISAAAHACHPDAELRQTLDFRCVRRLRRTSVTPADPLCPQSIRRHRAVLVARSG